MPFCKAPDCKKHACFGPIGGHREFCKAHKPAEYVNVAGKRCSYIGCSKGRSYGNIADKIPMYCGTHRHKDHVLLGSRKCNYVGCKKIPSFGNIKDNIPLYCKAHKSEEHTALRRKQCIYTDCKKYPIFGNAAEGVPLYCAVHKLDGHVDLKHKLCSHSNCSKRANYKDANNTSMMYCAEHRPAEYISDIKKCAHAGCATFPVFGSKSDNNALYCSNHKLPEHTDIRNKRCTFSGCLKKKTFGNMSDGIVLFCATHKNDSHVNLKDILCKYPECKKHASYSMPGYTREYCAQHKKPGMVSRYKKVSADKKTCTICCTDVHYSEMYCPSCKTYLTDGKTVKRHQKEIEVKGLLDEKKIAYTHDIVVKDGCSKKRPDFVIATTWGTIILEVDEHQHNRKTYTCECELTRMRQLYFDVGVENLLFIRYNPDTYDTMSADKPMPKKQRKEYLAKYLQERLDTPHQKLGVVYLFYDKFTPSCVEIEAIDPYLSKAESS